MAANTRFATGVHILVLLASESDKLQTSTSLAEHLNTNPVVIRRVLSSLQRADLITSQKGPTGGSRLAKPAKMISLAEIYRAVESNPLFYTPQATSGLPGRVNGALDKVFVSAKKCVITEFDSTTLASLLKKVAKPVKK
jgi:Rrf2 family protein